MNRDEIKNHLIFIKQNIIDLNNSDTYLKIDEYFDRTIFLKNIEFLENNSLIIEDDQRNCIYSITDKEKNF